MELSNTQKRILEIEKKLTTGNPYGFNETSFNLEYEKGELLDELRVLKAKEQFLSSSKQIKISKWVGIGSVVVGIIAVVSSVVLALYIPYHQTILEEQSQIEGVYKNLVTNQDIFISNFNNINHLVSSNNVSDLPEFYIENDISDDVRKVLQNKFGLVQYRFFLYYLQQTKILNEEIKQIQDSFITTASPSKRLNSIITYLSSVKYLSLEGKNTKFNHLKDTECLQFFFEKSFSYLTIDGRGKVAGCENETLEARLFYHFGYLPDDTPKWLKLYLNVTK
jgi:hypothetical protein